MAEKHSGRPGAISVQDDLLNWNDDRLLNAFQETGKEVLFTILWDRYKQELRKFCTFVCWSLRIGRNDPNVVQQLIEEPWLRLKKRHQTLAGFDPKRGTFPMYMRALLRDAIAQHKRRDQRKLRKTIEFVHLSQPVDRAVLPELWLTEMHEFGATLHGAVKRYWNEVVLQQPIPPEIKPLSAVNKRRLKSRLHALYDQFTGV